MLLLRGSVPLIGVPFDDSPHQDRSRGVVCCNPWLDGLMDPSMPRARGLDAVKDTQRTPESLLQLGAVYYRRT